MQVEFMGATKASVMVVAPTWSMWWWGQEFENLRLLFQFCGTLRDESWSLAEKSLCMGGAEREREFFFSRERDPSSFKRGGESFFILREREIFFLCEREKERVCIFTKRG